MVIVMQLCDELPLKWSSGNTLTSEGHCFLGFSFRCPSLYAFYSGVSSSISTLVFYFSSLKINLK